MKELVFLPDREGRDELADAAGFVRLSADGDALKTLADRLVLPEQAAVHGDQAMWRGVLALALLCDAWPDSGASVATLTVDGGASLFAAWVLSARPLQERRDALHLVLLDRDGQRRLLGVANARCGLTLPATPSDFAGFVPLRAAWYDRENDMWHDPVPFLNEHERAILLARLTMMGLDAPEVAALKTDLAEAGKADVQAVQQGDEAALDALAVRIQAVCGLDVLEAFTCREEPCAISADNALVRLYSSVDLRYETQRSCATYLWRGVPFARTSAALGLTGAASDEEAQVLAEIAGELQLLAENSVRWNQRCADGITDWLAAQDAACLPESRMQAEKVRQARMEKARQVQLTVTLQWPWDASSGAVRYLLREALGDGWMGGAAKPFSDCLTRLTGHMLGDNALQSSCACADGVLLPPISQEMAACMIHAEEGAGLAPDMMRFEPREDGGMTASFLLRGMGEVRMVRTYPQEEILTLAEAEAPSVAVWPCLPMERWHAYHIFARGGETSVAALSGGEWKLLAAESAAEDDPDMDRPWRCLHTETYPACLTVMRDGQCLGVLPNALPKCRVEARGDALAAIDMGASTTAVALRLDGKPLPIREESLTRMLVMPQTMEADEFLLSLTPRELTPSAVMLTGEGDGLFSDGYACAAVSLEAISALEPGAVASSLKWRADARSVRARRILLHQVMLGASLNALLAGAESIRWRITVADEMGDEGRDALLNLVDELSVAVAQESGLILKDGKFTVAWAEEAAAQHAFLCTEGGMKGTFAVLDIGGASTKLHLWMQGKPRPLGGAVLMEGASTVLMTALRENPEMLRTDFADCGHEGLIAAVETLCQQLTRAGESHAQADKAVLMIDALLETYRPVIVQHLYSRFNAQQPTCIQAILLEMYAAAMFNVGLMLEHAGADDNITHLFPGDLTVCLTGRGAWLLDTLTPQLRNGLQHIGHAPMQLRHPVRTLTVRPAALPAMGVAQGMLALKNTDMPVDPPVIRTRQSFSELMRMMLECMQQHYPLHVWTLHPGLFDAWNHLTPAGEDLLRQVASQCYGDGEDIPAAVMDFMAGLRKATTCGNQ